MRGTRRGDRPKLDAAEGPRSGCMRGMSRMTIEDDLAAIAAFVMVPAI